MLVTQGYGRGGSMATWGYGGFAKVVVRFVVMRVRDLFDRPSLTEIFKREKC